MTLDQAKDAALKLNNKFNICDVYENGYHFYTYSDLDVDGDNGAVVLEDGRVVTWIHFILNYHPSKKPIKTLIIK